MRVQDTFGICSTILFYKGNAFCDFLCLLSMKLALSVKVSILKGCSNVLLEKISFENGGKHFDKFSCPENYPFHHENMPI